MALKKFEIKRGHLSLKEQQEEPETYTKISAIFQSPASYVFDQFASTRPASFWELNFSSCSLHTSLSHWFQEVPLPASQSQNQQRTSLEIACVVSVPFSTISTVTAAATCSEYYKRPQKCPKEVPRPSYVNLELV